jgi:outer membrane protein OmpA-like peptidoglycan-associated protein
MPTSPKHGLPPSFRGPIGPKPSNHDDVPGRRPPKSCAAAPHLRVGNECRDAVTYPDLTVRPNLTGRWIDKQGRFNFFVNQAGPHLECLLALVGNGNRPKVEEKRDGNHIDERPKSLCFRLLADRIPELATAYILAARDDDDIEHKIGILEIRDGGQILALNLDGGRIDAIARLDGATMSRAHAEPSFFERYLGVASVAPSVRTAYWFPLTPQQEAFLSRHIIRFRGTHKTKSGIVPASLEEMIRAWINLEREHDGLVLDGHRQTKAEEIDHFILEVFNAAQTTPVEDGGIHECQQLIHQRFALEALMKATMRFLGEPRSLYEMLLIILERIPRPDRMRAIPKFLGIDTHNPSEYVAEMTLQTTGVSFKKVLQGGRVQGTLELFRVTPPGWKAEYTVDGAAYGVKFTQGQVRLKLKGRSSNAGTWLPEQVPGPFICTDFSFASGHRNPRALVLLSLFGSGPGRPKGALSIELGPADAQGFGLQISGMSHIGTVTMAGKSSRAAPISPSTAEKKVYGFVLDGEHQHFYATNNAHLTTEDEARVQRFVATELVAFSDPSVEKTIVGHTDRPDEPQKNQVLSENRANTVFNYIQALLGRAFEELEVSAIGRGEEEAEAAEANSPVRPNMKFRRVDIYIGDDLVFSTRGPHPE